MIEVRLPALLLTAGLLGSAAAVGVAQFQANRSGAVVAASASPAEAPSPSHAQTKPVSAPADAALPDDSVLETEPPVEPVTPEPVEPEPPPAPSPVPIATVPIAPVPTTPTPLPAYASIPGIRHEYQRMNNCGPVTIGMALNRWGSQLTQYDIAPTLEPGVGDVNVSPDELAAYARSRGMDVHLSRDGDRATLRALLAAGFPVIVETWFITHDSGGMGHYRLLTGYDDATQQFSALDSYLGPLNLDYATFDGVWRAFGRTFLVVTPPAKTAAMRDLLGQRANPAAALAETLRVAEAEAARIGDAVSYLNVGHAQLDSGHAVGAARAFDQALAATPDLLLDPTRPAWVQGGLPWRALWYEFGPLEAYARTGQYAKGAGSERRGAALGAPPRGSALLAGAGPRRPGPRGRGESGVPRGVAPAARFHAGAHGTGPT